MALVAIIVTTLSYGCATVPPAERPLVEKDFELVDLKRSLAETNMKIEELNNKFMLLQERVSNAEVADASLRRLSVDDPEDLKVVKLTDEEDTSDEELPVIALSNKDLKGVSGDGATDGNGAETETAEDIYLSGQNYFFSGDYELARSEFERLVSNFPSHTLSDNALYWAGESYYSRQDFESAMSFFERVVKDYPMENKAPDAMLKVGLCQLELGDEEAADKTLRELIRKYPHSPASLKAVQRLKTN